MRKMAQQPSSRSFALPPPDGRVAMAVVQQQIEAIVFAANEVVTVATIRQITGLLLRPAEIKNMVERLNKEYEATGRTFRIHAIAGGYRMLTCPEFSDLLRPLNAPKTRRAFSRSLLEVLAVIAYNQPVTRADIQQVRGVSPDYAVERLLHHGLIEVRGRADAPGRPLQYGTTAAFLDMFHLSSLTDLPKLREIREILQEQEEERELQPSNKSNNPLNVYEAGKE
jgi:segregation and condensation protein B